jgi:hypothetical protein
MGCEVGSLVHDGAWNQAVVYRKGRVYRAPIGDLMKPPRLIPQGDRWVMMAQTVGSIFKVPERL